MHFDFVIFSDLFSSKASSSVCRLATYADEIEKSLAWKMNQSFMLQVVSEAHVDDVEEMEGKGRKREKGHVEAKSTHTHAKCYWAGS